MEVLPASVHRGCAELLEARKGHQNPETGVSQTVVTVWVLGANQT